MRSGLQAVARRYVLYRHEQAERREREAHARFEQNDAPVLTFRLPDDTAHPLDYETWAPLVEQACDGLRGVNSCLLFEKSVESVYVDIAAADFRNLVVLAAHERIEAVVSCESDFAHAPRVPTCMVSGSAPMRWILRVDFPREGWQILSRRTSSGTSESLFQRSAAPHQPCPRPNPKEFAQTNFQHDEDLRDGGN